MKNEERALRAAVILALTVIVVMCFWIAWGLDGVGSRISMLEETVLQANPVSLDEVNLSVAGCI